MHDHQHRLVGTGRLEVVEQDSQIAFRALHKEVNGSLENAIATRLRHDGAQFSRFGGECFRFPDEKVPALR